MSSVPPAERPVRDGPRVLIVDDHADGAELIAMFLTSLSYETRVAYSATEAMGAVREFWPHVALLDIGLPGTDGYALARDIRDALGDRTPVLVAMTGYSGARDRADARAAGFAEHITKPIHTPRLAAVLRDLLHRTPPNALQGTTR